MKYGREGIETRRDKNETGYVTPVSLGPYHNFTSTTTTTTKQLNQNMGKKAQAPRNKRQQRQIKKKPTKRL